jgi:hypothetical protein
MSIRTWLAVALLAPAAFALNADEPRFVPLVEGDDPKQFDLVEIGPDTISIRDGVITITGKPAGYFATKKSYSNYILKFDWMYERPDDLKDDNRFRGNSGLLVHITGPDKIWPKCIEVQLANIDAGNTFAIYGARFTGKKDSEAQRKAIKPVGQWNEQVVTCRGDSITCTINGIEVAQGTGADPAAGRIGWQSEGGVIKFRKIMIKPL